MKIPASGGGGGGGTYAAEELKPEHLSKDNLSFFFFFFRLVGLVFKIYTTFTRLFKGGGGNTIERFVKYHLNVVQIFLNKS